MSAGSDAALTRSHLLKCDLASEVLRSSGHLRLQVTGWSMLPSVWPGDTLLLERAEYDQVAAGDLVLFRREGRLFVHRVIEKAHPARITTQGDAMPTPDASIAGEELLGKVAWIVRAGKWLKPAPNLSLGRRAVAAVMRRSKSAARVVVGVHDMYAQQPVSLCQD